MGRIPYTPQEDADAVVDGIPDVRVWSDDTVAIAAAIRRGVGTSVNPGTKPSLLALSGGGSEGAYGAGFLTCWTQTGTRPQFSIVTGASVGGLIAPFAFLGSAYDPYIEQMFTSGETDGLLQFAGLPGLFGSGLFREEPLRRLVDHYVTRSLLDAIAAQYRRGRRLMVVTTDLDNQRTALWDMGRIASSQAPQALDLFRSVLLASAAIPGVFPPEEIPVESGGRDYSEMHVDGGVTANVLAIPEGMLTSSLTTAPSVHPDLYIIIDGKIVPDFELAKTGVVDIVTRSFETTLKANTLNGLIATAEYAKRQGWALHTTSIAGDIHSTSPTDFSAPQMRNLFAAGCNTALSPKRWSEND
ncbi:MAG TPA: patatin-like phospholipase family protein [Devosiaceae bacterium]|nr:patatin-like phospholipase family protein [Devosiaceae bacterium]